MPIPFWLTSTKKQPKTPDIITSFNDEWNTESIFSRLEYRMPKELINRLDSGPPVPLQHIDSPPALRLDEYWLREPVIKFLDEMKLTTKNRARTPSVRRDYDHDHGIYSMSTHAAAEEFVDVTWDDAELVNYIKTLSNRVCRLWHCSDLSSNSVLGRIITKMFLHSEESRSSDEDTLKEKVNNWLNTNGMEFVGFVERYTRDEEQRKEVLSFQVSAFLMYHRVITNIEGQEKTKIEAALASRKTQGSSAPNLEGQKSTKIEAALASREMQGSSALERLIQIVQLLHTLKFNDSTISFEVNNEEKTSEAIVAMTNAGMGSKRGKHTTTLSIPDPDIVAMASYNFAVAWRKHRPTISIRPDGSNPQSGKDNSNLFKKVLLDLLSQFNKNPFHIREEKYFKQNFAKNRFRIKGQMEAIVRCVNENHDDESLMMWRRFQRIVFREQMGFASEIHLGLLLHFVIWRLLHGKKMGMLETTLELLQRISIKISEPSPKRYLFRGDGHMCHLYCSRCNKAFGPNGPLERVLASIPAMVLIHYGFLPKSKPENSVAFDMLPPLFSTQKAFSMALDHAYRSIEDARREVDDMNLLCRCVAGRRSREDMVHFVSFSEAVKIDSHFSSTKGNYEARKMNTRIFLSMLFERMAFFRDEYTRPEPNDDDENDWAGYARETETREVEGGGAAADRFEDFGLELKIMKLLWALMDRFLSTILRVA